MECQSGATSGAAPAGISAADMSACPPGSVGRGPLVTEDQREVGPLSGGVMSPRGSTPIRPITGRPWLAPSSCTRRLIGSSRESLSLCGGDDGLTTFRRRARVVRSQLFAGGAPSAPGECQAPGPDHVPFWPKRPSIFRLSHVTALITAELWLTNPPDPSPRPHRCSQSRRRLALRPSSGGRRLHCPGACYPGRVLSAERQVLSAFSEGLNTATTTTSCRTDIS
jgi:hypothetical protein